MAEKRTPADPLPTTHAAVREEIKYWQERFNVGSPGAAGDPEVRQRLEALYALDRASATQSPSSATPRQSRLHLLFKELVRVMVWLRFTLGAWLGRR